jgi:cell division protein FtsL
MSENTKKPAAPKKPAKGGSLSVSKFIVILAAVAGTLLLIVNNSVTVDSLLVNISTLDSTYTEMKFENDSLQAELKRLSSAERITRIASEKLGLVYSAQTLEQLRINKGKLQEAEEQDAIDSAK